MDNSTSKKIRHRMRNFTKSNLVFPQFFPSNIRVHFCFLLVVVVLIATWFRVPSLSSNVAARSVKESNGSAFGINLSGPADWNTEIPFVDVFRLSRSWISQRKGSAWGTGPTLDLDENGWVRRLEKDCFAETPLCTIEGGHYPSGLWTVLWEGKGKIEFSKGTIKSSIPGEIKVEINSAGGGFFLKLLETDSKNPVKNIQVLMPKFNSKQNRENPWRPQFLQMWQDVACIRFMDFQETNNSKQRSWTDRPTLNRATYSEVGVPIELMCDLANRIKCDAWFCIPHLADDLYVAEFAKLVKSKLGESQKVYIEYSNEVWNSQFEQHKYAAERGKQRGLAEKPWECAWLFYSERSLEVFKIWEKEFGADRLVRVLASQGANSYVSKQIVQFRDAARHADALAIAPYLACNVFPNGEGPKADEVAAWTVEQLLDHVKSNGLPEAIRAMNDNWKVAKEHGLRLVCYEAGQHFVGVAGAENNEKLTKLFHAANRHPRLKDLYSEYFSAWDQTGADLLCYFSSVGQWSKFGSWGVLEYADSKPEDSVKFQAIQDWKKQLNKGK